MEAFHLERMQEDYFEGQVLTWPFSAHGPENDSFFSAFNDPEKGSLLLFLPYHLKGLFVSLLFLVME
jgi:hypothetical protein